MQVRPKQPEFPTEVQVKASFKKDLQSWSGLKLRELLRIMLIRLKGLSDTQICKP